MGIGHSKYFPGLFNECIYFTVLTGERVAHQEKIIIDKKINEYIFRIKIVYTGINSIIFSVMPSCSYGQNEVIKENIECISHSEKRKKLMDSINKRKEKLPLSYFQEVLKDAGFKINEDSDEDEEEEDETNKKEEEIKKSENNINNNNEIKEESVEKEN